MKSRSDPRMPTPRTPDPSGSEPSDVEPPLWEQERESWDRLPGGERLQKVLAAHGFGSRRTCEDLISQGRVRVNGQTAILGRRVDVSRDVVEVDGVEIGVRPGLVYYLLNKPAGVVTTSHDPQGRRTVLDIVPSEPRVFAVGRLDYDTEGLLLLTNDGALAHQVSHPSTGVEKEYVVEVEGGRVSSGDVRRLREGIDIDGVRTAPAEVSQPAEGVLRLVIHEGRNRQVRRMCESIGHPVVRLVRVRIGPLRDPRLEPGRWRELTTDELRSLTRALAAEH